jgi:hypothetical protein
MTVSKHPNRARTSAATRNLSGRPWTLNDRPKLLYRRQQAMIRLLGRSCYVERTAHLVEGHVPTPWPTDLCSLARHDQTYLGHSQEVDALDRGRPAESARRRPCRATRWRPARLLHVTAVHGRGAHVPAVLACLAADGCGCSGRTRMADMGVGVLAYSTRSARRQGGHGGGRQLMLVSGSARPDWMV